MTEHPTTPSQMAQRLAGFGTWSWDVADDTVIWSQELYRIYGRDPADFVPTFERFLDCIDPRDRARIRQGIVDAVRSGSAFEHEERIVRGDGQIRLLRSTGRVERDGDGRPVRVTGACLDITEHRAAQVALREREAELRLALAAARMGTFTWWVEQRRLICSAEVQRLVGAPLNHIDDLRDIMSESDRCALATAAERALRDPAGHLHARFRVRLDDETRWLQLAGAVDPDAGELAVKGTLADITEQALLEAQALRAQKMESVGRLAGGVAHDFNNLLTVILAEAALLEGEPDLGAEMQESLSAIGDAAQRAAELTRRLLTIARDQPLRLDHVDISAVLAEAAERYGPLLGPSIALTVEHPAEPAPVLMDAGQLEQLLLHLVSNAGEAMPDGGRLQIRVLDRRVALAPDARRHGIEGQPHVVLEVTDSGDGVPEPIVDKIFEPFFSTKARGTGLGLSTCHNIVQRHGGVLECLPEPTGGTTFRVILPRAEPQLRAPTDPPSLGMPAGAQTILLAEDDPQVRRLARRVLLRAGYRVVAAEDGQAALALLDGPRAPAIDILVTDVVMPRLGGVPLARAVQARRPDVPVLFISGYTADAFADGIPDGATLLRKPFLPAALIRRVRALLDGQPVDDA